MVVSGSGSRWWLGWWKWLCGVTALVCELSYAVVVVAPWRCGGQHQPAVHALARKTHFRRRILRIPSSVAAERWHPRLVPPQEEGLY